VNPRSPARPVTAFVAAFFIAVPLVLNLLFLRDDEVGELHLALAAAWEAAATLLALGVVRWYGRLAVLLRAAGFAAAVLISFMTFSLAFVLLPVALLATPSLRNYRAGARASA
jgi:hypothetical protein